ncbi:hypothetical protein QJS10_CPB20g02008 [Acorus calamus]|uniref:DUF7890 domain-containing protein n=1 Tax=Acorus calamus TaxID=4465 RepID=A0AAV9CC05_ACOCL|nr:hypothetical protein QJS10_CPB20g02008 [Acorus calamus]
MNQFSEESEGGYKRVKILLTKQELALLMSKCDNNDNGRILLENIARELKVKANCGRIAIRSAESLRRCSDSWRPALDSIIEDC